MGTHWNSKVCGGDILILVRVHLYFLLCMVTLRGDFAWYKAWNTKTEMKLRFQGPSSLVCSMAITNEMLFAGTGDGRIMAWRFPAKDSNTEPVLILSGHQRPVISLSISARRLYSGSLDKTIKVWIFLQDIAQLALKSYAHSDTFFNSLYLPGMGPYNSAVCPNTL